MTWPGPGDSRVRTAAPEAKGAVQLRYGSGAISSTSAVGEDVIDGRSARPMSMSEPGRSS
jgi:hypothetical protein